MTEPIERRSRVVWEGNLRTGHGLVSTEQSRALVAAPVTWPARLEEPSGRSSPEELLAAAHASCYAMALAGTLTSMDASPERLHVRATCGVELTARGLSVTSIRLRVRGLVPGVDGASFRGAAEAAARSCTVSRALSPDIEVEVDAELLDLAPPERTGATEEIGA